MIDHPFFVQLQKYDCHACICISIIILKTKIVILKCRYNFKIMVLLNIVFKTKNSKG